MLHTPLSLALCALGLAAGRQDPEPAPDPMLEALVHESSLAVLGDVLAIETRAQSPPLVSAELWPGEELHFTSVVVRESLLGSAPDAELLVLFGPQHAGATGAPPELGERALLFLVRAERLLVKFSPESRQSFDAFTRGRPIYIPMPGGLWPRHAGGGMGRPPELTALPEALAAHTEHIPEAALLAFFDARLEAACPSFAAILWTTGVTRRDMRLAADGSFVLRTSWSPRAEPTLGKLERDELTALWSDIETAGFFELPPRVGRSPGPDTAWRTLTARTREHGVRKLRVHAFDPLRVEDDPVLRAQVVRTTRIWDRVQALAD